MLFTVIVWAGGVIGFVAIIAPHFLEAPRLKKLVAQMKAGDEFLLDARGYPVWDESSRRYRRVDEPEELSTSRLLSVPRGYEVQPNAPPN